MLAQQLRMYMLLSREANICIPNEPFDGLAFICEISVPRISVCGHVPEIFCDAFLLNVTMPFLKPSISKWSVSL